MTSKGKNILTCLVIILLIIFIYIPVRTGLLEKQFIKSVINSTEKIILSVSTFENEKKLKDKDLSRFYTLMQNKYSLAMISIADKQNQILKAGKNDKYIVTNAVFDSIIDSFTRDEFKSDKKNDFTMRYFEQRRFYIFQRYISEGKILLVYPYSLSTRMMIQLALEMLLIAIIAVIVTAFYAMQKNRKTHELNDLDYSFIRADEKENTSPLEEPKTEVPKKIKPEKKIKKQKSRLDIDKISDIFYEQFTYISGKYKPSNISFYIMDRNSSEFNKIFELKGKSFIKIKDGEFNSIKMNKGIITELEKSSIIYLDKGKNITIPVICADKLTGIATVIRDREFKGPEITDIKSRVKIAGDSITGNIKDLK
jgi:hypothetical protein